MCQSFLVQSVAILLPSQAWFMLMQSSGLCTFLGHHRCCHLCFATQHLSLARRPKGYWRIPLSKKCSWGILSTTEAIIGYHIIAFPPLKKFTFWMSWHAYSYPLHQPSRRLRSSWSNQVSSWWLLYNFKSAPEKGQFLAGDFKVKVPSLFLALHTLFHVLWPLSVSSFTPTQASQLVFCLYQILLPCLGVNQKQKQRTLIIVLSLNAAIVILKTHTVTKTYRNGAGAC